MPYSILHTLLILGIFSILHAFLLSELLENSTLHALFHPAQLINFQKISSLHALFHPAWLFDRLEYIYGHQFKTPIVAPSCMNDVGTY